MIEMNNTQKSDKTTTRPRVVPAIGGTWPFACHPVIDQRTDERMEQETHGTALIRVASAYPLLLDVWTSFLFDEDFAGHP